MRFLHTSDWHLGRLFHGRHLTADQAHVLDQLIALLPESGAEALLISGDIYDRAVPPVEAVELFNDVLERIVLRLGIPVIAIAGNHDSPRRLAFAARLLAERGLHVFGPLAQPTKPVVLSDEHGPVHFHGVPYAEPADVRQALDGTPEEAPVHNHDAAMRAWLAPLRAGLLKEARHVVLAHGFVAGAASCDSERPLSVGGAGTIGADAFDGFDYVALGHLHEPQRVPGAPTARYAGSLLKYSFSEATQKKRVLLVDLEADGTYEVEPLTLQPRHDMRIIEGTLAELLAAAPLDGASEDYLLARLADRDVQLDPLGKLRAVYPNVMQVERLFLGATDGRVGTAAAHLKKTDRDLFAAFFLEVEGEQLGEQHDSALRGVLEDLQRRGREQPGGETGQ